MRSARGPPGTCRSHLGSVYRRPRHRLDLNVRVHEPSQTRSAVLGSVWVVLEVTIDTPHKGFITASRRLLFLPGPVFDRRFRGEPFIDALFDPFPPGSRCGGMEQSSGRHGLDPLAGQCAGIENRELRPVVLEALPFLAAPDGDQVVGWIGFQPGHRQAAKDSIPPLAALCKNGSARESDNLPERPAFSE